MHFLAFIRQMLISNRKSEQRCGRKVDAHPSIIYNHCNATHTHTRTRARRHTDITTHTHNHTHHTTHTRRHRHTHAPHHTHTHHAPYSRTHTPHAPHSRTRTRTTLTHSHTLAAGTPTYRGGCRTLKTRASLPEVIAQNCCPPSPCM